MINKYFLAKMNIPTIKGTNVLTVDTTVQPSNVYIKVGGG